MSITMLSRIKGCILGSAVGDAMGAPLEGLRRAQIRSHFGRVDGYVKIPNKPRLRPGTWTDDTALSLATLQCIVAQQKVCTAAILEELRKAILYDPDRGYGPTTRKALDYGQTKPKRSAGNGAAMRIAPVALFLAYKPAEVFRATISEICRLTHQDQSAIDGALAVSYAIALSLREEVSPKSLIDRTIAFLRPDSEMSLKLFQVKELLEGDLSAEEAIDWIGTRGLALESVGTAFYCFLRTPNSFYSSIVEALNAGGDTDTIASLTGALSGPHNGISAIPKNWTNPLEKRDLLAQLSEDLAGLISDQAAA